MYSCIVDEYKSIIATKAATLTIWFQSDFHLYCFVLRMFQLQRYRLQKCQTSIINSVRSYSCSRAHPQRGMTNSPLQLTLPFL